MLFERKNHCNISVICQFQDATENKPKMLCIFMLSDQWFLTFCMEYVFMVSLPRDVSICGYQEFIEDVYGMPNARHFDLWDMMSNASRFTMRALKGIRKNDSGKAKFNLSIALSWFISVMNRLHIDIETRIWERFPYACSYCASCPCECREKKPDARQNISGNPAKMPKSLAEYQKMFDEIYPSKARTLEHAGVHLAEEFGELSEAILAYRGSHNARNFEDLQDEAADFFSCMMGVFNSLGANAADELSIMFLENCHDCHMMPCGCEFSRILNFRS